jgi:Flp pilus assembly pilin Flp
MFGIVLFVRLHDRAAAQFGMGRAFDVHFWERMRRPTRSSSDRLVSFVLIHDEHGQNVVEYGLLIASIVVVILMGMLAFGHQIEPWFNTLAGRVTTTGT